MEKNWSETVAKMIEIATVFNWMKTGLRNIQFFKNKMEAVQSCLKDFDVLNKLGEGAFGQVFKVKRKKDGKEYALKKVKIGAMKQK